MATIAQLNIKHREAYDLARKLAERTGESMSEAVVESIRERLARLDREREEELERRLAEVKRITASLQADMKRPVMTDEEFDRWMYDENGLPH